MIDDSGNLHLKLTYANGLWYAASMRTVNPYTRNINHWTHAIGLSITHTLTWQPDLLKFEVNRATSDYASWQGTDTTPPYPAPDTTGTTYAWICVGDHTDVPPSDPYTVEVVFSDFHYAPLLTTPA